jgi:RNA polymerase sigma factor (sigma-70 family)
MKSPNVPNHLEPSVPQLRAMRRGEAGVLQELYAKYAGTIYAFVQRRVRSHADAADIVHDVFVVALSAGTWERFSGETSFVAFLQGIARNRILHHFRARGVRERAAEGAADCIDDRMNDDGREADAFEVKEHLQHFLSGLDPRDSKFFVSHLIERPARRITAEQFGMTEDQVRYLEKKLRERVVAYLKRVGYLDQERIDPAGSEGSPDSTEGVGIGARRTSFA